jgi:hypothetical protein
MVASALPLCPHCGAPQDEPSRAESRRRDRTTWLAIGIGGVLGAALGLAVGWAVFQSPEWLVAGLIFGLLAGRVWVAVRHGW